MSHNTYTINNEGADVVSYHGAGLGVLYIGHGGTDTYPTTLNDGDTFEWYDPNPINTVGATLGAGSSTGWIDSITLPAGTYWFRGYCAVPVIGSNFLRIRLAEGATDKAQFFAMVPSYYNDANFMSARSLNHFTVLSSSTVITFNVRPVGITIASDTDRISESQYLFIKRIA